jgi:hypothetical protein
MWWRPLRRRGGRPESRKRATPPLFLISSRLRPRHGIGLRGAPICVWLDLGRHCGGGDAEGMEAGRQAGKGEARYNRLDDGSIHD